MDIGEYIKTRRQELGLTQEEIARACDVNRSAVCMWEKGRIQNMKRDKIQKLAKVLSVNPVTLIRDESHVQEETTAEESELLRIYRSLSRDGKRSLMALARTQEEIFGKKSADTSSEVAR